MKEKLYKEKVFWKWTTELHYNKHEIKTNYKVSALSYSLYHSLY